MNEKWQQHLHAGLMQVGMEAYAEAVIELSQALVEAPDEHVSQCYSTRGYAHLCNGDFVRAIDDCDLAIENDPSDGEAYAWRGSAHAGQRQWSQAIDDYIDAIGLSPENEAEYREVLLAHLDEAISDFTHAIRGGQATAEVFRSRGTAFWRETLATFLEIPRHGALRRTIHAVRGAHLPPGVLRKLRFVFFSRNGPRDTSLHRGQ